MKRGGKVGFLALGTTVLIVLVASISFGDWIPWWYAYPMVILLPVLLVVSLFGFLMAYGDGLFTLLERAMSWMEDK